MGRKIFVYRKGALGDTIAFIPFIFTLKRFYTKILFAGNYLYRQLFSDIDFVEFLDGDSKDVLSLFINQKSIEADKYLIFSRQNSSYKGERFLYYDPLPKREWFYKYPFDCLCMSFKEERVYMPLDYDMEIDSFIGNRPFIVLHPGSGGKAKRWPLENFLVLEEVIKKQFNIEVFYLLGEAEIELKSSLKGKKCLVNMPLKKVIFLLSRALGYVGSDSGISHLAGILNVKGFVVFGMSSPEIYRPFGVLKVLRGEDADVKNVSVDKVLNIFGGEIEKGRSLFSI